MKALTYIPLLFVLMALPMSCDNDKDDDPINRIEGSYSLVTYQCCLLTQEQYDASQIVFEFDGSNSVTVTISTTLPSETQLPIQTNGIYDYTEIDNRIVLDGIEYDFTLIGEQLTLFDEPEVDGAIITFIKLEIENN